MKVLWLCNIMLPVIANYLKLEENVREGWLSGLAEAILKREKNLELAIAFPVKEDMAGQKWIIPFGGRELLAYGFYENTVDLELHDEGIGERLIKILEDYEPDIVHCFGTEYDHAEALLKVWDPAKILIGIQGVCGEIANAYYADLPEIVVKRSTLRDWLKRDNIQKQKEKFERRAQREKRVLGAAMHVTGRTSLDRKYVESINPNIAYYLMNETLRAEFYNGCWDIDKCEKHSIFVSQGDYPIKGFHYVLHALPYILKDYPDAKVYVAGNSIVSWKTWKDRIKISSYGKYLRELLLKYQIEDKVCFEGKLSAEKMKERMLKSHLFLCSSAMENSPNSLGEAMLLGVPCASADIGGVPDLFVDGKDGLLYEGHRGGMEKIDEAGESTQVAQAKRLAEVVSAMWGDQDRLLEFSKNAREHGRKTHDGEKNVDCLLEIYAQLLNRRAEGRI